MAFQVRKYDRQQLRVGGAEVEGRHLGGGVPAEGLVLERDGLRAGRRLAVDERQVDRAVGVGVGDRRAEAGIDNLERDLLAALAGKRLAGRLSGFDLPPDELPVPALRLADRPPTKEEFASSAYDATNNLYHFLLWFHATFFLLRIV